MTFEELKDTVKKVPCQEIRAQADHYLEVVVAKANFAALHTVLQTYFGPPLKPQGVAPTGDSDRYAGRYGGVRSEQILYVRPKEKGADVALLWPWGGGSVVTLKLIRG